MQTQVIERRVVGVPWLERSRNGSAAEQHPIHTSPFSIGRVESADLQIDDSRVSREHAVILRDGEAYRIRDLHSTNGTLLNGEPVQDAELTDGDILVIADVEFTFYTDRSGSSYSMATEVIGDGACRDTHRTRDMIRSLRRLQESLTHRAVAVRFEPVVEMASATVFGHQALRVVGSDHAAEQQVLAAAHRIAGRLYQTVRLAAVEEAARRGLGDNLFLPVDASEIGSAALIDSLARLARATTSRQQLIVALQESVVCDIPYYQTLCLGLRDLGIRTAFCGFAGTRSQVAEHRAIAPQFLLLAPTLTQGIARDSERQRQVRDVARACHDTNCRVVACGLSSADDARVAADMGCTYGQGPAVRPQAAPAPRVSTPPAAAVSATAPTTLSQTSNDVFFEAFSPR